MFTQFSCGFSDVQLLYRESIKNTHEKLLFLFLSIPILYLPILKSIDLVKHYVNRQFPFRFYQWIITKQLYVHKRKKIKDIPPLKKTLFDLLVQLTAAEVLFHFLKYNTCGTLGPF